MALYDSCDSTELSGELNENRHHQIYNTTCDEMSIEKIPKGAPDSNGLDQYDYADMSAGDSTSGTSQLQIASLSQEEQYMLFLTQMSLDFIETLQLEIKHGQSSMNLQCQLPIFQK
jgi:hypothetical protein